MLYRSVLVGRLNDILVMGFIGSTEIRKHFYYILVENVNFSRSFSFSGR